LVAPLVSTIQSHNDAINSIDFYCKNEKYYVIIASADCSVSLNDINGNQIGLFGQTDHWKLDPFANAVTTTTTRKMSNSVISQSIDKENKIEDLKSNDTNSNEGGFITELNNDSTENLNQDTLNDFVFKREYTGLAPHLTFQFEYK
jgi:hypothetical protein